MYDAETRAALLADLKAGASLRSVSVKSGVSRATLRSWQLQPSPKVRHSDCPVCTDVQFPPRDDYLYLLGLYLGDGCISKAARTTAMRIACANSWRGLMDECERTLHVVSQRNVYRIVKQGCTEVLALWQHWPCLFPQHGTGMKHNRLIALDDWQCELVDEDPRPLVRGLIHSDGYRGPNVIHRRLPSGTHTYAYSRYLFTNESRDILAIYTNALDQLGIAWKQNRWNSISVARREAVAALDEFVGPKY